MSHRTHARFVCAILLAAMPDAAAQAQNEVARGKYLVTISGCHDCHTPKRMGPHGPVPDMSRMLSLTFAAYNPPPLPLPLPLPPGGEECASFWPLP